MTSAIVRPHSRTIIREDKPQPVTEILKGRKIERLLKIDRQLVVRCDDGIEVRLSWRDERGRMAGTPYLDDVRRWK